MINLIIGKLKIQTIYVKLYILYVSHEYIVRNTKLYPPKNHIFLNKTLKSSTEQNS